MATVKFLIRHMRIHFRQANLKSFSVLSSLFICSLSVPLSRSLTRTLPELFSHTVSSHLNTLLLSLQMSYEGVGCRYSALHSNNRRTSLRDMVYGDTLPHTQQQRINRRYVRAAFLSSNQKNDLLHTTHLITAVFSKNIL